MILPTKHITVEHSLIGVGGLLLGELNRPATVSALWDVVREQPQVATFERYTLALDLLFIMDAVELRDGKLQRVAK